MSSLLGCPSLISAPPTVWLNVSSTPWLLEFHEVWFSDTSGCLLFLNLLLSFFWLCEEVKHFYLCLHLGQNSELSVCFSCSPLRLTQSLRNMCNYTNIYWIPQIQRWSWPAPSVRKRPLSWVRHGCKRHSYKCIYKMPIKHRGNSFLIVRTVSYLCVSTSIQGVEENLAHAELLMIFDE